MQRKKGGKKYYRAYSQQYLMVGTFTKRGYHHTDLDFPPLLTSSLVPANSQCTLSSSLSAVVSSPRPEIPLYSVRRVGGGGGRDREKEHVDTKDNHIYIVNV